MAQEILWIVGTYVLGAALVHVAHWRFVRRSSEDGKHYVLYSLNDGHHLEWAVQSIRLFHWLRGQNVTITLIDEGSTDDTLGILNLIARAQDSGTRVRLTPDQQFATLHQNDPIHGTKPSHTIHIRLRYPEDRFKLLLMCRYT